MPLPEGFEKTALRDAPAPLLCADRAGSLLWINAAAARLLDLPGGEWTEGQINLFDCLSPDDRNRAQDLVARQIASSRIASGADHGPRGEPVRWHGPAANGSDHARWIRLDARPCGAEGDLAIIHLHDASREMASRDLILTSGDLLRRLEEIGQTGLWWYHLESGLLQWSDGTFRIHGLDPSPVNPSLEEAKNFYHEDDRAEIDAAIDQAVADGLPFTRELRIKRSDGQLRTVRVRGNVETGENGRAKTLWGVIQDIQAEAETGAALRTSEERYARTVSGSGIGLWDWDIPSERVHASARFMAILAFEPKETVIDFAFLVAHIHAQDRHRVLEALETSLNTGGPLRQEFRMLSCTGKEVWVRAAADTRLDADGKPVRMSGSLLDISLEKGIHLDLEAANQKLVHIVDSSAAILYTAPMPRLDANLGRDGVLVPNAISESVHHILGYAPETIRLLNNGVFDLLHPEDRERVAEAMAGLLVHKHLVAEYRLLHADGDYRWLRDDMRLVRHPVTRRREIIGCAIDFTAAKQTQHDLIAAKEEAQAANRAKSDFLAMMSHEIRTPMNAVLGMLDLLRRSRLDDQQTRYVGLAEDSARNLLYILNDILDFSKLDVGRMELETIDFVFSSLVDGVLSILRPKAEEKGLELNAFIDPAIPLVLRGDPGRIRQILLNLLTNAVKFTDEGQVEISASLRGETDTAITLRIEVHDTGIGMAPETVERLFSRFMQADSSIRRRFGGTGLGLAICRQLCDLMSGRMGVESEPGFGSTFWFDLPLARGDQALADLTASVAPEIAPPDHVLDVLVAEDNPVNQTVISSILEKLGHQCTLAGDGKEAVELLRKGRFDLVLMDVQMPVMDGVTATKVIRILPVPLNQTPVVALTANAMAGDRESYLAAGFSAYLAKPIDVKRLKAALDKFTPETGPKPDPDPSAPIRVVETQKAPSQTARPSPSQSQRTEFGDAIADEDQLDVGELAGDRSRDVQALRDLLTSLD